MRQLIYSLEKNVIMFPLRQSVLLDRLLLRCESHNVMQIFEHRNEYNTKLFTMTTLLEWKCSIFYSTLRICIGRLQMANLFCNF